ncbi:MAG TPA: GNAT family N-acetyltransferase [Xanthobacteraceae bacterium]|jgi:CelD/BcsL family acetyltransferase involved in cellulose biosynthesis
MSHGLTSELIRDATALAALETQWWRLWTRVPSATPFQSPAWLLPWWRAFAPGELSVVAVRSAGRLVALACCYIETGARGRRILPMGISVTDYHDVLIDPEFADPAAAVLASSMTQADWDEWEFGEIAPGAQAFRLPTPSGCVETVEPGSACPVLALPDRPEALRETYPARKRRSLRLARNRAARRGRLIITSADAQTAVEMFEELVRLHCARWSDCGETGVLADPPIQQFHRDAVPRLLSAGLIRLCVLRIADQMSAAYYGFLHRSRAYGYLTGFDPAYKYESPSVILLDHVIAQALKDGAREFHFLRGREPYKYGWGAVDRWNKRRVFRRMRIHACAS